MEAPTAGNRNARYANRAVRSMRPELQPLFDRLPPHALEAEMALLGSMIIDHGCIDTVLEFVGSPDDFYSEAHASVFDALRALHSESRGGDLVALTDAMRSRGLLDEIGGVDYLVRLAEQTPSAASAPHYAKIVREKAQLRRLIDAAGQIMYEAYTAGGGDGQGGDGARSVLDAAEQRIFDIAEQAANVDQESLERLLNQIMDALEANEGRAITGYASGYSDLDEMTSGLQPGELIILAARPSMGKCLDAEAEITLADGEVVTIEEVCRRRAARLFTLGTDLKITHADASDFIDDGIKPVFEVTTRLGRRVRTTLSHPFLTINGWHPLGGLVVGDAIAVPRRLEAFGQSTMRECEVKLLAYLIGDGGLTGAVPRFTSANPRIAGEFHAMIEEFGDLRVTLSSTRPSEAPSWRVAADRNALAEMRTEFARRLRETIASSGRTARDVGTMVGVTPASVSHWISAKTAPDRETFERLCVVLEVRPEDLAPGGFERIRKNEPNRLTAWLNSLGLMGHDSHTKFIPAPVFTLQRDLVALFLNRLFSTDGWATVLRSGRQAQIGYSSVSERLARQVQHLLLRFGIIASLRLRWVKYKESRRPSWQLDITDSLSIRTFAEQIGIFAKDEALTRAVEATHTKRYQTNRDLIPVEIWDRLERIKGSMPWSELARRIGASTNLHVGKRAVSRARLARFAEELQNPALRALAESDVYWDRIVSIEPLGPRQVYDLTVDGTHNFVANDVCVHNTALALNLAEQIAFGGSPYAKHGPATPVGFFSMEMSRQAIAQRLLCARAGVDSHRFRTNRLRKEDFTSLMESADALSRAPLFIDDTPSLSVMLLRAKARRMVKRHQVKCLFIDYLQLMTAPAASSDGRQQEVSAISRGVKALARELNIPIICLAQLNRGAEQREGHRPRMADLRESGSIEQDADVIMLLHREEYYHVGDHEWADENPDKVGVAELIIAKQRNGPTGAVNLSWDNATTRFKNHASQIGSFGSNRRERDDDSRSSSPRGGSGNSGGPASGLSPKVRAAGPSDGANYARSSGPVGFAPGSKSGPEAGFRDGGGPAPFDDDDDVETSGLPI